MIGAGWWFAFMVVMGICMVILFGSGEILLALAALTLTLYGLAQIFAAVDDQPTPNR